MKIYIFISNIDRFVTGDYRMAFTASSEKTYGQRCLEDGSDYPLIGECEIDLSDTDIEKLTQQAVGIVDKATQQEMAEHQVKMNLLKDKKASLLSITHNPLKSVK